MAERGWCRHTNIHTRVNETYRISSIWREYGDFYFNDWAWETFVWKRENGEEKIDYQPDTSTNIDCVMRLHKEIYDKIVSGQPYEGEVKE
jgi:hypothetical protein